MAAYHCYCCEKPKSVFISDREFTGLRNNVYEVMTYCDDYKISIDDSPPGLHHAVAIFSIYKSVSGMARFLLHHICYKCCQNMHEGIASFWRHKYILSEADKQPEDFI